MTVHQVLTGLAAQHHREGLDVIGVDQLKGVVFAAVGPGSARAGGEHEPQPATGQHELLTVGSQIAEPATSEGGEDVSRRFLTIVGNRLLIADDAKDDQCEPGLRSFIHVQPHAKRPFQ